MPIKHLSDKQASGKKTNSEQATNRQVANKRASMQLWIIGSCLVLLLLMAITSSFIIFRQLQTPQITAGGSNTSNNASQEDTGGTHLNNPVDVQHITLSHLNKGDDSGHIALSAFEGKTVLAFFGYTHCPDICPITLMDLAELYQGLGEPEDLQIMMVTVDAQRDTPEVMQAYVENFHPSFLGFSGSTTQIIEATKSFFVGFAEQENKLMLHTDSVFLIDTEGKMRSLYAQDKLEHLSADIQSLMNLAN